MLTKRIVGNTLATLAALLMGAATTLVSIWYLSEPEKFMDWAVQICAGITVGIIVFFMVWGHFQSPEETVKS